MAISNEFQRVEPATYSKPYSRRHMGIGPSLFLFVKHNFCVSDDRIGPYPFLVDTWQQEI